MNEPTRHMPAAPLAADVATDTGASAHLPLPTAPFDVAVIGAGRVGGSLARALERAGHRIVAELGRDDDPSAIASASVVVIAVPDDALAEAAGVVARVGTAGAVVIHTSGLSALEPLAGCGDSVAAIHPAVPVASRDQDLTGVPFGITCAPHLVSWCEAFVRSVGGLPIVVEAAMRPRYHAALVMASNFAVTLAGDAAALLGGHDLVVPLLRATVENIAQLGPDDALTGPVVRGDAGTVDAHLAALPAEMRGVYLANAQRTLERARASGRLAPDDAARIANVIDRWSHR